jgi:preprotein translocase subunit YajC
MEINWIIVSVLAFFVVVFIIFLIKENQKAKKKYTHFLNTDFKKAEEVESDLNDDIY